MADFKQDAQELLRLVGGDENINAVTHCATRLRFALADNNKANVEAIEALPSVKGTFTQAGQFQVIIGNEVSKFYEEFAKFSNVTTTSTKEDVKAAAEVNQAWWQRIMTFLAEVFAPIIPAIICLLYTSPSPRD